MRQKITLFILAFLIARCRSQDPVCEVTDPDGKIGWDIQLIAVDPIKDVDKLELTFAYTGDLQANAPDDEPGAKYIDITAADSVLSIKTNDYFTSNYETDQKGQPNATSLTIIRTLTITCQGTSYPFTMSLYIQDTNNNPPKFLQDSYTYTMPMPLVPRIDLTNFGDIHIIAEDIDFSNTKMTFTVEPADKFALDFNDVGNRQYQAILKVTEFVRYDKDLELTITATDETEPFHTATATIIIKKDNDFSQPDIPTFSEPVYAFTYSNEGGTPTITPDDATKEIVITTSNPEEISVSLSDETHFKAEYDKSTNKVTISLTETPLESTSVFTITLILTVTLGSESSDSAILIKLPSDIVVTIPTFTAAYYTATYSVDGTVTLDAGQEIAITQDIASLDIQLEGDNHFSIKKVEDIWTLQVDTPLESDVLKGGDIPLTLHATVIDENSEKHEGYGAVIIKLPEVLEVPRFTQATYTATYTVDSAGVKDAAELANGPINIAQTDETVEISIVESSENFKLIKGTDGWTVDVSINLEQSALQDGKDIVLTLSAAVTDADVEPGYSTLIITLPEPAPVPTFSEPYYTATYKIGTDLDTLEVDGTIQIVAEVGQTVTVEFGENSLYKDSFDIECDGEGKCTLKVKTALEADVLTSESEIILVLEASKPDIADTSKAAVIIRLPLQDTLEAPEFSETVYVATYVVNDETGEVTIETDKPIQVNGETDVTQIGLDVDGEYKDAFSLLPNGDHWDVTTAGLGNDIVEKEVSILLNLKATKDGISVPGVAGLVIQLPKSTEPKILAFTQVAYIASYTVNSGHNDDEISIDNGPIQIDGIDASTVTLEVEDTYKQYFETTSEADHWNIKMLEDLPSDITDEISVLVHLKATIDDRSGECALVVKLPKKVSPASFHFEDTIYSAQYEVNDADGTFKLTFEKDILLEGDTDGIAIATDGVYKDNFAATYADNKVSITIPDALAQEILDSEVAITFDIIASKASESATATAVVKLPRTVVPATFYFENTIYIATYSDGAPPSFDVEKTISVVGDFDDSADVVLDGEYKDYFDLSYNAGELTIELKDSLPSEVVNEQVTISVDIKASRGTVSAAAILLVQLPKNTTPITFYFSQTVYEAQYEDSDPPSLKVENEISIEGDSDNTAEVVLSGDYKDYFTAGYRDGKLTVTVKDSIPSDVLESNSAILVDIVATRLADKATTTLVVKLPKTSTSATFYFAENVYIAQYEDSDSPSFTVEMSIEGDSDNTAQIILLGDYKDYFTVDYSDGKVTIAVKEAIPSDVLDSNAAITVEIVATRQSDTATTTLVVKLAKQAVPVTFYFDNNVYTAQYDSDSDTPSLTVEQEISIVGDSDNIATIDVSGEFKDYFTASYSDSKVTIALKDSFPSDVIENNAAITVDIVATRLSDKATASIVVKLPKKVTRVTTESEDQTGLIAAVSVLAVLLVASLVGSAVFYYFKFRRGSSYNDMDEGRPSERFRKNSATDSREAYAY